MLHSRRILRLFELRGRARVGDALTEGMRVGRGFADVGYEEFLILGGDRILSLLSGAVTALNEIRREHLFEILSVDQLISEIHRAGFEIQSLKCIDRRSWAGVISAVEGSGAHEAAAPTVQELLLLLLLAADKIEIPSEERCLKSVMVNG